MTRSTAAWTVTLWGGDGDPHVGGDDTMFGGGGGDHMLGGGGNDMLSGQKMVPIPWTAKTAATRSWAALATIASTVVTAMTSSMAAAGPTGWRADLATRL